MEKISSPSVAMMWNSFIEANEEFEKLEIPPAWHFCDKKEDADELAQLVLSRIKTATCSLLQEYQNENEKIPKVGQLDIVTDWAGKAQAIIRIIKIEIIPFNQVTEDFAYKEGEGDRTLAYWRQAHWHFFERQLKITGEIPTENMMLVCEQFELLWQNNTVANTG